MTKETLLHDKHVALNAKMVDFAGWHMPVQYQTSIIEEHNTVRNAVGLFDVSHMGELFVSGKDALDFLNSVVPQDINKLTYEKAVYCQLTNREGGLIDDLILYKLGLNEYLIICNASRYDEDLNWLVRNSKGFDVKIDNQSHNYSLLAVQGPKAADLLHKLGLDTNQDSFTIKTGKLAGVKILASRTGYTGEDGYEILTENKHVGFLWDRILAEGQEFGIKPIGLGARDTLRLEAALHLYGNDLDESTTPIEAGLSWSIPKDKKENYNGKDVIMNQVAHGGTKKIIGLKMLDKSIARHGYDIYFKGEKIGHITSGAPSPTLGVNIALAYVKNLNEIWTDSIVQVMIREKLHNAQVVKRPFVSKHNKVKGV